MSPRSWLASFIDVCSVPLPIPLSDYQSQSFQSHLALLSEAKVCIAIANNRGEKHKNIAEIEVRLLGIT